MVNLFIFAGISAVIGAICAGVGASKRGRLYQLQSTQTSTAAELEAVREQVERDVGPDSFVQRAEVKGTGECEDPLRSEFTGTPCAAYSVRLEREYEETQWETDSEGRRSQKTVRSSETLSSQERRTPFWLKDSSGRVRVLPDGAELDMEKTLSRFESSLPGEQFKMGSFVFDLARAALGSGRRTLGYKYEESILPLGKALYVLGEAASQDGKVVLRRSTTKGEKFIISVKSEEELTARLDKGAKGLQVASLVTFVLAAGLAIAGIVTAIF